MIKISINKGKFQVSCPFGMNHLLMNVSGKKWSSGNKCYQIPFSRKAVEGLMGLQNVSWDDDALKFIAEMSKKQQSKIEMTTNRNLFPSNYIFKTAPRDCQTRALNFLWGKKEAALFMKMRTGKTKTVIDWASCLNINKMIDGVVVFCPISVKGNWEAQINMHSPIESLVGRFDFTNASERKKFKGFIDAVHELKYLIVGTESMSTGSAFDYVYDFVSSVSNVLCVVDESHMIKGFDKERTLKITNIGSVSEYRVILTGTPITKEPLDLYSQYRFLDPDIIGYGDYYSFRNRYAIMGGYENREIVGYQNIDELLKTVAPYTFQVSADEVVELPPKEYRILEVELSPKVRALYNKIGGKNNIIIHNDKELIISNALDRLMRKIRLVNGVMSYGESGIFSHEWVSNAKIIELLEFLESNPSPSVIWTNGKMEMEYVVDALKSRGLSCSVLHGGMSDSDRIININRFQDGGVDHFVSNISAGCAGIDLSRAEAMIYMSNSFKFVDREQSEERATNFSDVNKTILIVDIIAKNTVDDEIVMPAIRAKKDIADFVDKSIKDIKGATKFFEEVEILDV